MQRNPPCKASRTNLKETKCRYACIPCIASLQTLSVVLHVPVLVSFGFSATAFFEGSVCVWNLEITMGSFCGHVHNMFGIVRQVGTVPSLLDEVARSKRSLSLSPKRAPTSHPPNEAPFSLTESEW